MLETDSNTDTKPPLFHRRPPNAAAPTPQRERRSRRLTNPPWPAGLPACLPLPDQNYNLSACFQKSFERLRDRLEGLEGCVAGLEDGCSSISGRLSAADASMQQFTMRAEALRDQRAQLGKHADQASERPREPTE